MTDFRPGRIDDDSDSSEVDGGDPDARPSDDDEAEPDVRNDPVPLHPDDKVDLSEPEEGS